MRRLAPQIVIYIALVLALGACTYGANVKTPPAPAVTETQRLPLAMGVYYPPEFLSYVHRQPLGGSEVTVDVGNTSATHFSQVFASYFDSAVQFPARPSPEAPAGGVDAVLIPQIESMGMTTPGLYEYGGTWTSALTYRFQLVDPVGTPIATWLVSGQGSNGGADWVENVAGGAYSKALAAAGRNFVKTFGEEIALRDWLEAQGVQTTLRPLPWPSPGRALAERPL